MKRLGHVFVLLALFCPPLLAERVVKVEALSTDTTTFRQNKIQLGMVELAAQLAPYQSVIVDLTPYALLAGDADGQVIQGISGSDQARVDIGVVDPSGARLIGSGSTPTYVFADNEYAGIGSFGGTSSINVSDAAISINATSGTASINFGTTSSWMDLTETYFEVGVGAASLNISETAFRVVYGQTPPTNANDTCTAGDTIDTATFHYYCAATNTWVRVAMATWP